MDFGFNVMFQEVLAEFVAACRENRKYVINVVPVRLGDNNVRMSYIININSCNSFPALVHGIEVM